MKRKKMYRNNIFKSVSATIVLLLLGSAGSSVFAQEAASAQVNPAETLFYGMIGLGFMQGVLAVGLMATIGMLAIMGGNKTSQKKSNQTLIKSIVLFCLSTAIGYSAYAQDAAPAAIPSIEERAFWAVIGVNVFLGVLNVTLIFALLMAIAGYYQNRFNVSLFTPITNLFSWERVVGLRSSQANETLDTPLDHNYDGIVELDNNAPPVFNYILYGTITFAIVYMVYYHVIGTGVIQEYEYRMEMQAADAEKAERMKSGAFMVDENSVKPLKDDASLAQGQEIFTTYCAACHGQKGEGKVGPNFTDEFWLHGGGIKNIFKTVKNGVLDKGMIAWDKQLSPAQMAQVASYILTLQGTNPPNPKAPQGEKWTGESGDAQPAAAPDSTKIDTVKTDSVPVKKGGKKTAAQKSPKGEKSDI